MTRAAAWKKYDGRSEAWKAINAPDIVAQTYLARTGHWKLPRLLSVISAPTLRPDGTILQTPGYDATRRRGTTRAGWIFRRFRRSRI
jgi:putative DNA primase/helicase